MPHLPVCSTEVGGPVVHQTAPTLKEITARVGRLGGVLYLCGASPMWNHLGVVK